MAQIKDPNRWKLGSLCSNCLFSWRFSTTCFTTKLL